MSQTHYDVYEGDGEEDYSGEIERIEREYDESWKHTEEYAKLLIESFDQEETPQEIITRIKRHLGGITMIEERMAGVRRHQEYAMKTFGCSYASEELRNLRQILTRLGSTLTLRKLQAELYISSLSSVKQSTLKEVYTYFITTNPSEYVVSHLKPLILS